MKIITLLLSFFFFLKLSAQVGIGTTEPSGAAMLEVSSSSNDVDYKGFMPPRVSVAQRDKINATKEDAGLIVFVNDAAQANQCLQIWNGSAWQDIYCINDIGFSNIVQNFDSGRTWSYSSDIAFFDNGDDGFYGITEQSNLDDITTLTNNFLGILDLNDEGDNGTTEFATLTFDPVDIASLPNGATVSFNYEFFEFDGGDACYYTIVIDGEDQAEVLLIEGAAEGDGISSNGMISEIIPAGTLTVALRIRIKQNGAEDSAGFDNFTVSAN
ncbi:hypothetical protein [Flavimarina sp. Hel_I_48]|uniref:hypothetical protein n=1 Tax=Flavimarina sp. Hel_I_48 TaxID=1392488 RepID=UPI0004DF5893|nr:hypothetical protein [Flavimarina sp. Hel_I_48]